MNGDVGVEALRPRPLSTGLWTIFSWLRRSERSSSSESISSVGSDRTAASFDFLAPIYYPNSQAPITLPINSPTDSYKRRVQERNLRRQRERGVTLHRKYGLWREEGGYDGFSLPPASKNIVESGGNQRCRRAASECFHRRAAYVPGKRHAPPPPTFVTTSLPRSYKRKRPAPKPPLKAIAENKENIEINNNDTLLPTLTPSSDNSTKQNIVNNVKGTGGNSLIFIPPPSSTETHKDSDKQRKEIKLRTEKSFLKQIFENKKRHSADISHVKFLPSISELDKQAAEIIENNKLTHNYTYLENNKPNNEENAINSNSDKMWMCTKCLRKYNTSMKSCVYCVPKENELTKILNSQSSSSSTQTELSSQLSKDVEEKKKLREILKEMKDSLPKKPNQKKIKHTINFEFNNASNETPTLRIGTTINENKEKPLAQDKFQKLNQEPTTSSGALSTGNHSINKRHTFIDEITNNSLEGNSESLIRAIITSNNLKKPLVQAKPNEDSVSNTKAAAIPKSREIPIENSVKFTHDILLRARDKNQLKPFENSNKTQAIKENKITTTTNSGRSTHTPLSISSLLNPIYQPKATTSTQCFQVTSKTNINTEQKTVVSLNSDVTSSQLKLVTKIPAKDLDNTNAEKNKFKKEPTNASPNQIKLDPKTVSQIIKKSIEQKEKQLQENEAKIEAVKSGEYIKRRELINQLESSIAKGDETAAAEAASKLAKLRLSCSVLSYSSQILAGPSTSGITIRNPDASKQENFINKNDVEPQEKKTFVESQINKNNTKNIKTEVVQQIEDHKDVMNDIIPIEVWIEDKIAARGPVHLTISQRSTIADLKREALSYLGIEIRLQRWIVGKSLCTDDNVPIISLAGTAFDAPFYLCLVESDENKASKAEASSLVNCGEFYTELIKLEQQALILNSETFECGVCLEECALGDGAVLRDCLHTFCKECLSDAVRHCEEPIISCPAVGCPGVLQDREIRALLSAEDYEKWLARGLAVAESGTRNNFHCRTPDCSGWAFCEPGVRVFPCPVCKRKNCIPCQALHDGETCEQYQKKLREVTADNTDEGTQALLDSLISRGEALRCPECQAIITKKWGCDWVKCSACKTEICWVTKGRRWGPGGRGDTSGGCKCGVEGKKCHPTCSYCH
ncbi:uncharacterized protein LOC110998073 [Pieris rapae]|uniref:uncharacterized protein LOC110998073 n=1 Tax=Pieris rapae TaxID=64459 RepID=UPI001E27DD96|nr:uncharacterized protein LOC110998073 [Pieris rapae]XP_022122206.2 uncharacterized protein LOC110998073 [Pieris rapae]XP_045487552.1 uncharacterized protein LOC110998073 [Pieris rapae]